MHAQDPRRQLCSADSCLDGQIFAIAIDTVFTGFQSRDIKVAPPRIWRTLHMHPFRSLNGRLSPAVDAFQDEDLFLLRHFWPDAQFVDSANVVGPDGESLRPGGAVVILAPVSWRGADAVAVHMAVYWERINYAEEWYVFMHRTGAQWTVDRALMGRAN